jgi:hypothetical protein
MAKIGQAVKDLSQLLQNLRTIRRVGAGLLAGLAAIGGKACESQMQTGPDSAGPVCLWIRI